MTRDEVEAVIAHFVRLAKSNEAMHTDWSVMSSQAWYHATDLLREALNKSALDSDANALRAVAESIALRIHPGENMYGTVRAERAKIVYAIAEYEVALELARKALR